MKENKFSKLKEEAKLADESRAERLLDVHNNTKDPRAWQLLIALEMISEVKSGLQKNKLAELKGQLRKEIDSYLGSK